ncbi:MAG TPA: zinc ribbon domain-containing protein [bacterium]|nr:zinc ribbon domain-containing protein [bacterium]
MPTYEYKCSQCGYRFEKFQKISDAPLNSCPECDGSVVKQVSGGAGIIMRSSPRSQAGDQPGACCERGESCDQPRRCCEQ